MSTDLIQFIELIFIRIPSLGGHKICNLFVQSPPLGTGATSVCRAQNDKTRVVDLLIDWSSGLTNIYMASTLTNS